MKAQIVSGIITTTLLLAGCGQKSSSNSSSSSPTKTQQDTTSATTPVMQPALTAWEQGDMSSAVSHFLEANWNARPLFPPGSVLSLSEDQFKLLSAADRQAKSGEMMSQLDSLKQLAAAVAQAGRDAASKGDSVQARKCFTALKQCGEALDGANSLAMVKLVGQGFEKRADAELGKLGQ